MKRQLLLLPALFVALACSPPRRQAAPIASAQARHEASPPPALASGKSTDELGLRPEVSALVEELATAEHVSASQVSIDGHEPPEHKLFVELARRATPSEMVALLEHRSSIVRGYAAQHMVAHQFSAERVATLMGDSSPVSSQRGCFTDHLTISLLVVDALCDAHERPEVRAELERIAGSAQRLEAQRAARCLRP